MTSLAAANPLIVVLDGECVMCSKFARFVAAFSPEARLMWAQHPTTIRFLAEFQISFADVMTSIVAVKEGTVYRGSDAFIQILHTTPWYFKMLGYLMMIFPKFLREFVYSCVANNRYTLFGKYEACQLPPASMRAKFLH